MYDIQILANVFSVCFYFAFPRLPTMSYLAWDIPLGIFEFDKHFDADFDSEWTDFDSEWTVRCEFEVDFAFQFTF